MPKATKKKKEKAADFHKAKLKLGKGKQQPSNVIDTSFKARSINLPNQSIASDRDAGPSTKRKLTFDDLIIHLKHYNPGTRKDALHGLRELFTDHPELLPPHLTALVNACVRVIADDDASVRKTLLSFLSWLLSQPQLSRETLAPHTPLLLLFTTSAQTHIFPDIRIDAVKLLDVLMEAVPEMVVAGWDDGARNSALLNQAMKGKSKDKITISSSSDSASHGSRVLEGYLGILNGGTKFGESNESGPPQATSTASVVLSTVSKAIILKSLAKFLHIAITSSHSTVKTASPESNTISTWYIASAFDSLHEFQAFDSLLRPSIESRSIGHPRLCHWKTEISPENDEDWMEQFNLALASHVSQCRLADLSNVDLQEEVAGANPGASETCDPRSSYLQRIAHSLQPLLVATFLDSAPTVFSPSSAPSETELQLVLSVAQIVRSIHGGLLRGRSQQYSGLISTLDNLRTLLGYFSPYFPFVPNGNKRDVKVEQAFQDLNLIYCELTSLVIMASRSHSTAGPAARKKAGRQAGQSLMISEVQVAAVRAYIFRLLRGEGNSSGVGRSLSSAAYTVLLPTIWCLMDAGRDTEDTNEVLQVVVEHAIRTSSTAQVKRYSVEFLGRLVLLSTQRSYRGGVHGLHHPKIEEWILHLPKTLWELGTSNGEATEAILRVLLRLSQRRTGAALEEMASALRLRLVPYFSFVHPTKGRLPGPFCRLPSSALRRLALDLVATLTPRGTSADDLPAAVDLAVAGSGEQEYWANLRPL